MGQASLGREYFQRVYADCDDPWNFAQSPYENAKYRTTIEALSGAHFGSGFEIGCSVGVLTALLAQRCDRLLAIDINTRALAAAQQRCAELPQVRFDEMLFPSHAPTESFDLVVVSEVAYYWSDADLARAIEWIATHVQGGLLELVHYLPRVDDYVRDGDAVHAAFLADPRFTPLRAQREPRYRIDILRVA